MSLAEVEDRIALQRKERKVRERARSSLGWFAERCLRVIPKEVGKSAPGEPGTPLMPLRFNETQEYVHAKIEAQRRRLGRVRVIILKGRQGGISTYVEARFYWKAIHTFGIKVFILTHEQRATDNLFAMVDRYHENCPPMFKPHVGKSNEKELEFDRLDSRYTVATAGAKAAGRSATIHFFHGSECGFWQNAEEHMSGALQAVGPETPGTEIILESTANGMDNEFHRLCMAALKGDGRFELIFVPWFWDRDYTSPLPDGFSVSDAREDVPEGEITEAEYAKTYKLKPGQIVWRRLQIADMGYWRFKREYPATVAEAFQASGERQLIPVNLIIKARNTTSPANGSLVIGLDPAGHGRDQTAFIRRKGRRAFGAALYSKLAGPQIVGMAVRIILAERPKYLFVDVGGMGSVIVDYLLENDAIPKGVVVPVNFGATETVIQPDRFKNKKAEMYGGMKEWFEDIQGVDIEDGEIGDIIQGQAQAIMFSEDGAQRLVIKSKEDMRKLGFPSPDLLDALALTFAFPVGGDPKMDAVIKDIEAGWPASHFGLGDLPLHGQREAEGWDAL